MVLSSTSLNSTSWVSREIMFGTQHPKEIPIIPVTLERVQIPANLQKWQAIDFSQVKETEGPQQILAY